MTCARVRGVFAQEVTGGVSFRLEGMDFKGLLRRAAGVGMQQGARYVRRQLQDPNTAAKLTQLLTGGTADDQAGGTSAAGTTGTQRRGSQSQGSQPAPGSAAEKRIAKKTQRRAEEYTGARTHSRTAPKQRFPKRPDGGYPGDYTGPIQPMYKPDLDGDADPGEIVWGWVPFEEDHTQGKDRPVLVIGHDGRWLLALMLTSKDHVPGGVGEVREDEHGTRYFNAGAGDWDRQGRQSEIRLDRIIRISDQDVRREGAIMPMGMFSKVVGALQQ